MWHSFIQISIALSTSADIRASTAAFFFSPSAGDFIKCLAKANCKLTVSYKPRSTFVLFETTEYFTVLCTGLLVSVYFWWQWQMDRRKTQKCHICISVSEYPHQMQWLDGMYVEYLFENLARIYFKITYYMFIIWKVSECQRISGQWPSWYT